MLNEPWSKEAPWHFAGKNADSGSNGSISKSASTNDENAATLNAVPANSPHSQTDNKNEVSIFAAIYLSFFLLSIAWIYGKPYL